MIESLIQEVFLSLNFLIKSDVLLRTTIGAIVMSFTVLGQPMERHDWFNFFST